MKQDIQAEQFSAYKKASSQFFTYESGIKVHFVLLLFTMMCIMFFFTDLWFNQDLVKIQNPIYLVRVFSLTLLIQFSQTIWDKNTMHMSCCSI